MFFFLSLKNFILSKLFQPIFYQLGDLISSRSKGNKIFMLTAGSHKMIRIFVEIIVSSQEFFFRLFGFFFSGLIGFGRYYDGLMASYCIFRRAKKSMCVCVSVF